MNFIEIFKPSQGYNFYKCFHSNNVTRKACTHSMCYVQTCMFSTPSSSKWRPVLWWHPPVYSTKYLLQLSFVPVEQLCNEHCLSPHLFFCVQSVATDYMRVRLAPVVLPPSVSVDLSLLPHLFLHPLRTVWPLHSAIHLLKSTSHWSGSFFSRKLWV